MPTLRVYYFGLIAHISESGQRAKDYAALVRDDHHNAVFISESGGRSIVPAVRKITIGNPNPNLVADTDQLFVSYVPPLKKILRGNLSSTIKEKIVEMRYPGVGNSGSILSVAQLYRERALYTNDVESHHTCVARITMAAFETDAPYIVIRATNAGGVELWTETVVLDTDRCVLIANIAKDFAIAALKRLATTLLALRAADVSAEPHAEQHAHQHVGHGSGHGTSAAPGATLDHDPHVRIFGGVLDGDVADQVTVVELGTCTEPVAFVGCDWVKQLIDAIGFHPTNGDTVECGNTQWP